VGTRGGGAWLSVQGIEEFVVQDLVLIHYRRERRISIVVALLTDVSAHFGPGCAALYCSSTTQAK
jgi:hypothetical protein